MEDTRNYLLWADTELKRRNQLLDKYNKQQEKMIAELRSEIAQQQQRIIDLNAEKFFMKAKCDKLAKQVAWLENRELDLLKQMAQSKQEDANLTFGQQLLQ